jgi:predicted DNA-binding transcriptional regulator YafY
MKTYLTIEEFAQATKMSVRQIYRYLDRGIVKKIQFYKGARVKIPISELRRFWGAGNDNAQQA